MSLSAFQPGNRADREGQSEPSRSESCLDQPVGSSVLEVIRYTPSPLPAKHYHADTTEPISCGLRTLEELLSWGRSEANPFNVAAVPLAPREPPLASCPRRTLVSHDMMGGYLDDRFVQGTNTENPFVFYHWQHIDIFNYFTHQLVTIPPAAWTNVAHKHGVIVLGTFITEWSEGAAVCEAFLKDEESYRAVADKLVQISLCYGFDGWLVNIENVLSEAAVKRTPPFLRYLSEQMHERVSGSLVLWYDSVTEDGQLKWQNELNQYNRVFFDACDGFFTNYNWTEENLEWMKDYQGAQGRQADIYVGVDVFARGKVVGGMLETNKALEVIRRHNFSAAIFAPGWVYETSSDKSQFCQSQDKFWALLSDSLYVHRPASQLPFTSSFCQGFGKAVYWRGQCETRSSWLNLTAQEIQPRYYHLQLQGGGWLRSSGCTEEAWTGGCSLQLEGLLPAALTSPVCATVFSLHVPLHLKTLVTLIYKASAGIDVSLEIKTRDASLPDTEEATSVCPEALEEGHQLVSRFSQLCGDLRAGGWTLRCSEVELHSCFLREVCVLIRRVGEPRDTPFSCRLGEVMVLEASSLRPPSAVVRGLCIEDVVWLRAPPPQPGPPGLRLGATLRWSCPAELVRHFRVYWRTLRGPDPRVPPGGLALVGRAYSGLFRVTGLAVPQPPALLELAVEPVAREGFPVPESQWARRQLSYVEDAAS